MTGKQLGPLARRFGYTIAVFCNAFMLWIFHNLLPWQTPYLTAGWLKVLPAADLSLAANIVANAAYIIYDGYRFRKITEAATNIFGLWFMYTLYTVYPFDTSTIPQFDWMIQFCVITAIFATAAGILGNTIKAVRGKKQKKPKNEEELIH
jgi:hypothetical protein